MLKMSSQGSNREMDLSWSHGSRREGSAPLEMHSLRVVCWVFFFILLGIGAAEGASAEERNPFAFPKGVLKSEGMQKKGGIEKASQGSAPEFRVTTILVSGRTKVAAINGVLMKKGDKVDGYQILEIEDKQVTLVRGKEKQVLKIDSTVGHSFKKVNSNHHIMGFSK
jgi:hypothetical protein